MIQMDLFEGLNERFQSRQKFHQSVMAIVDHCWNILDRMPCLDLPPIQLPLFSRMYHPLKKCLVDVLSCTWN